jgi:hypothetical protein
MTPKEYKQMMDYLTRSGIRKQIKFASDIARPDPKPQVKEIELFNAFNRRNPKAGGGMLVQPGFGGTRQGYKGPPIKPPTKKQLEVTNKVYSKKYNKTGIDLWNSLKDYERSNIRQKQTTGGTGGVPGGKLKKNQIGKDDFIKLVNQNKDKTYNQFVEIIKDYKTKDNKPFTKNIIADRLRQYNLSGSFKKEPPKGNDPTVKAAAERKRQASLKETDPTKAKGKGKFQYHHVRQIEGGVPLTSDDVLIINQRINSKLGGETNKALNRISAAIRKNNKLALEAMNNKQEGLALDYMKRSDDLNAQAEKIVNSAIDDLPKKYKGYVGFNQFTLPRDEYGLPIGNEPMIIKKIGGMPVSKDAIDLTTLTKKGEAEFRKIVRAQAEKGKVGPITISENLRKLGFKCKFAASSGGVGSCDDPMSYVDDIKKQEDLLKVQTSKAPQAVKTLNTARKLNAARSLFTSTLGPGALAFEAVAALPIAYMGYKGGKSPENIIADATFNLIGKSDKRVFLDKAVEMGFDTAGIKRAQDFFKKTEAFQKQDARADEFMGPDDMFMYPQMVQKAERDLLDVTKQFIDPKTGQVIPERVEAFDQIPLVEQAVAKDQADLAAKRQEKVGGFLQSPVADYLPNFAGGGIAGLSGGKKSGPPPISGPTPDGDEGLPAAFKNVRNR